MTAPDAQGRRPSRWRLAGIGLLALGVAAALYVAGRLHQLDYTFSMFGADPIAPKSLLATIALALAGVQVLRGRVGHELIMLTGVSACIFDEAGRVLLAHHVDSRVWALPGGAVEPDEDPAAAVAREAREELGIAVTLQDLIGVYGGPQFRVSYPDGDLVSYVAIVYACTAAGTPAALDTSEVDEVRFVAHLDGLPTARWLPSVHADAVRWWHQRSVAAPGGSRRSRICAG